MLDYVFSSLLLLIALGIVEVRKSYHDVPKAELRFRARQGDALAEKLYRAVAYEESLEVLLWLIIVASAAGSFILFNAVAPSWLGFIVVLAFLGIAFAWLPKLRTTSFSQKLASIVTPAVVWILNYLHPLFKNSSRLFVKSKKQPHTGLYDLKDLLNLIDNQLKQQDSRLKPEDLELIKHALTLRDKTVGEHCYTWSNISHVKDTETVGPILLDELHKSGQQFVPVINELKQVVGLIDLNSINISSTGEIKDLVDLKPEYLNEDDTLEDALNAFSKSGSAACVVLDKNERPFGMITLKDVMAQLFSPRLTQPEVIIEPEPITDTDADNSEELVSA